MNLKMLCLHSNLDPPGAIVCNTGLLHFVYHEIEHLKCKKCGCHSHIRLECCFLSIKVLK